MNKVNLLFNIVFKKKYILIYFLDKMLLKQYYFKNKNKMYFLFYVYIYLYKFGFLNKNFKVNVYV